MRRFLQALSLLTRLPVRVAWEPDLAWGRLAGWFPLVGGAIGAITFAAAFLWALWPWALRAPFVGPSLLLALSVALTGALHLDGWGDCCDAFFTPVSPGRRLEIMSDPRMGSFGVVGLTLLLLAKFAALHSLLARAPIELLDGRDVLSVAWALLPLLAAPAIARWTLVLVLANPRIPLARPGGMGARTRDGLGRRQVLGATLTALALAAPLGWIGAVLLAVGLLSAAAVAALARGRIGGLTGDVLGAVVEFGETAMLTTAALAMA